MVSLAIINSWHAKAQYLDNETTSTVPSTSHIRFMYTFRQSLRPILYRKVHFRTVTKMASNITLQPRRFAPLKLEAQKTSTLPKLDGIVFDVDGTLCKERH